MVKRRADFLHGELRVFRQMVEGGHKLPTFDLSPLEPSIRKIGLYEAMQEHAERIGILIPFPLRYLTIKADISCVHCSASFPDLYAVNFSRR